MRKDSPTALNAGETTRIASPGAYIAHCRGATRGKIDAIDHDRAVQTRLVGNSHRIESPVMELPQPLSPTIPTRSHRATSTSIPRVACHTPWEVLNRMPSPRTDIRACARLGTAAADCCSAGQATCISPPPVSFPSRVAPPSASRFRSLRRWRADRSRHRTARECRPALHDCVRRGWAAGSESQTAWLRMPADKGAIDLLDKSARMQLRIVQ
jgi:hypothetical protein